MKTNLTKEQFYMWVRQSMRPTVPLYNHAWLLTLEGNLDLEKFIHSVDFIVNQNKTLNQILHYTDNEVIFIENNKMNFHLQIKELDFSDLTIKKQYLTQSSENIFDYNERLYTIELIKQSTEKFYLLLVFHHLIIDGAGVKLLLNKINDKYNTLYFDKNYENKEDNIESINYSNTKPSVYEVQFENDNEMFCSSAFPFEYFTNNYKEDSRYEQRIFKYIHLNKNTLNRILNLSCKNDLNMGKEKFLSNFFMATISLFFHLIFNEKTINIAGTYHNRKNEFEKHCIGQFVTTYSCQIIPEKNDDFFALFNKTYNANYTAIKNVGKLGRGKSRLYDVLFNFVNVTFDENLFKCKSHVEYVRQKYEDEAIHVEVSNFNSDIYVMDFSFLNCFDQQRINLFIKLYLRLLSDILLQPTKKNYERKLLSSNLRNNIYQRYANLYNIQGSNKTKLLEKIFRDNLIHLNNKSAIRYKNTILSYNELDIITNKLSLFLLKEGVKKQQVVIVSVENKYLSILIALSLLKLNAIYLPLDPAYPNSYKENIIIKSSASWLIIDNGLNKSGNGNNEIFIDINILEEIVLTINNKNIIEEHNNADLAYIIYTSGTTGNPKGVKVSHKSLSELISQSLSLFEISSSDNWILLHSLSFDFSIWEIFAALYAGGCLHIVDDEIRKDSVKLIKTIAQYNITILNQTPSAFEILENAVNSTNATILSNIKYLIFGGEKVKYKPIENWRKKVCATTQFINMYGITETTIHCTFYLIPDHINHDINNIGRPLPSTFILILDQYLNVVLPGVKGELFIGGYTLSSGYDDRNLTENSFIKLNDQPFFSKVCYRSGDTGFWSENGDIVYLSRNDRCFIHHGFRIDAVFIENQIKNIPGIVNCYLIINNSSLTVICQVNSDDVNVINIKKYLKKKIPDYMIPEKIIIFKELITTVNGKIDYNRLIALNSEVNAVNEYETNSKGCKVSEIICKALSICRNENLHIGFVEAGGNSFIAFQISTNIFSILSISINPIEIYRTKSIYKLISQINRKQENANKEMNYTYMKANQYKSFPLTTIQKAYLVGRYENQHLGGISTTFCMMTRFKKSLDIELIQDSFNKLLIRHPMLKARLTENNLQRVIEKKLRYTIDIFEYHGNYDDNKSVLYRDSQFRNLFNKLRNLREWPYFDIKLIKYNDCFALIFCVDCIFFDGLSLVNFFRDWSYYYTNKNKKVEPLSPTFYDACLMSQNYNSVNLIEKTYSYWQKKSLENYQGPCLPLSQNYLSIMKPEFLTIESYVDAKKWTSLKKKSLRHNVLPSVMLFYLFNLLIESWSSNKSFIINMTLFNRPHFIENIEKIIGDFTKSLLYLFISDNYKGNYTLIQILEKFQTAVNDDLAHNSISGSDLQRSILKNYSSVSNIAPVVFTSLLSLSNVFSTDLFDNNFIELTQYMTKTPHVWLDCQLIEKENQLLIKWDYVDGLFEDGIISKMHNMYLDFIDQIINANWDEKVNINMLSRGLTDVIDNYTNSMYLNIQHARLENLFLTNVDKLQDEVALKSANTVLTYKDLYQQSLTIVAHLNSSNINKTVIAILLDKTPFQIMSVIATLMANNTFLPLSTSWPANRINAILTSAKVKYIITTKEIFDNLNIDHQSHTIYFIESVIFRDQLENQLTNNDTEDAYIIYTSGTTGIPKGILLSHAAVCNTIESINHLFNINSHDNILSISQLSFDLAIYDIFGLLLAGGTIVLPDNTRVNDPVYWTELIIENNISIWNSVPALMEMFITYLETQFDRIINQISKSLRIIMLSGDLISPRLVSRIMRLFPNIDLYSLGGATEVSIWSVFYKIDKKITLSKKVPYGRALPNQKLYVLDKNGIPCNFNVNGEIFIGGAGLAKEYYLDNERTKESFIYNKNLGCVLYRTGDLGRLLNNGDIEILGRIDNQIKLNGHRIELGEIEAILLKHPDILDVIVSLVTLDSKKLIVAFLKTPNKNIAKNNIVKYLSNEVPSYMIPNKIITLDSFPMGENNKVDRNLLIKKVEKEKEYSCILEKGDPIVSQLTNIWKNELDNNELSIDENLFEFGSDSLNALNAALEINNQFGTNVTVTWVYQFPTIREQLNNLKSDHFDADKLYNPMIKLTNNNLKPLIFIHPCFAGSEYYIDLANKLKSDVTFYSIDAYNLYNNNSIIVENVKDLVKLYLSYITAKVEPQEIIIGGWSLGGVLAYELANELMKLNYKIQSVLLIDSYVLSALPIELSKLLKNVGVKLINDVKNKFHNRVTEEFFIKKWTKYIINDINIAASYIPNNSDINTTLFKAKKPFPEYINLETGKDNGWRNYISNLVINELNDDHFSILDNKLIVETIRSLVHTANLV